MVVSLKASSQASSPTSSRLPAGGPPELTTRMSRPAKAPAAALTRASTSARLVRSAAWWPAAPIWPARPANAPASREEMKTSAPSRASASAQARPRPLLAAETRARLPFSPKSTKGEDTRRPAAAAGLAEVQCPAAAPEHDLERAVGGHIQSHAAVHLRTRQIDDHPAHVVRLHLEAARHRRSRRRSPGLVLARVCELAERPP